MNINKYFHLLAIALAIVSTVSLTSCKDEPDKFELSGGRPEILYIRPSSLAASDSLLNQAYMEATLCIVGNNLTSIREMWFNDQKAILNTSFITDHTLIVSVPKEIPQEVSDKIYMITAGNDTVTYDFHVIVPGPTVTTLSYEYAPVGATVTITGDYFIDDPNVPLEITFPGNVKVTNIKEITKTALKFVVPEGATEEGSITVKTIYGEEASAFHYLESRGILFDFDGLTGLGNHGWHNRDIITDETAITGNFVQLGNGSAKMSDEVWGDTDFSFEYWPGNWEDPETFTATDGRRLFDVADFSNAANMSLKFDMYIPTSNPWSACAMQIIFASVDKVSMGNTGVSDIYGNTLGGCNNTYFHSDDFTLPRALYRPWTSTGSFDTNDEWITVTLPIARSFTYNYDGSAVNFTLSEKDFASLVMFVWGGGINGTECTPIIKIDNIRVVPNK